jgi:hypothetical protein
VLQPSENIDVRQAIAKTLLDDGCPVDCVKAVSHYLERVYNGERNVEDTAQLSFNLDQETRKVVQADFRGRQMLLYTELREILSHEQSATIDVMTRVYGLGTQSPSPFALKILSTIKLPAACQGLLRSQRASAIAPLHLLEQQMRGAVEFQGCEE